MRTTTGAAAVVAVAVALLGAPSAHAEVQLQSDMPAPRLGECAISIYMLIDVYRDASYRVPPYLPKAQKLMEDRILAMPEAQGVAAAGAGKAQAERNGAIRDSQGAQAAVNAITAQVQACNDWLRIEDEDE